ncbi:MAG: UDP-N-acetylmuramate--L-alanine ligase [bacterium]|nr:UDP-N-acetylmuramate--L-alanine ligase [bacterium]
MMLGFGEGERSPRVHFSGIGGTAMVAGARLALDAGWEVRGSDNPLYPPTSLMMEALAVPVATGYAPENLDWDPDLVVIGNALSRGNPEVEAALDRKLRYVSLAEWLKDVVLRPCRPVVVCGTHGKTTTTAITAYLLDRAGLDPGFLVGGQPLDFEVSARLGAPGHPFVIEGDEYDTAFFDKRAKFFHYLPEFAIVTSVEFDHGDIYRDLAEIERAFQWMLRQVPQTGWLIACADDPGAAALVSDAPCRATTYGFNADATWRGEVLESADGFQVIDVFREGAHWARLDVPLAGLHNLRNTLAAVAVAGLLDVPSDTIRDALKMFKGVRRRMETFLQARGVTFIDDFAHHPTAIRETIAAARMRWPDARLRVLFEPRSNTTVTNQFQDDLQAAFEEASEVWIGPIHRAERIPEEDRLDRETVLANLAKQGVPGRCSDSVDPIVAYLEETSKEGDVVLILSNGAFGGIYQQLRESFG